eukprot:CAMPEP_0185773286 /NCGR_PEP_ID=MMETSP1174-20130828/72810_1 /TAXON_ID=35687 /ORGANISM="Dictyocha speculum, Strain CCMP1381" /LENGTH=555 /DNA_ID=CAMNT_0028459901 /DNA_START=93 /DNA_END=1760 /DNA_ORIENTATION=-
MSTEGSLYDVFKVPTNATSAEIRRAYQKLALTNHPDKGGNADEFEKIKTAYNVLIDPDLRKNYDKTGKQNIDAEDEFRDHFNRNAQREVEETAAKSADNGQALAGRVIGALGEAEGARNGMTFEMWLRSRDTTKMTVTDDDLFRDAGANPVVADVTPLSTDYKSTNVILVEGGESFEDNLVVEREDIPTSLLWKQVLVNVTVAPFSAIDRAVAQAGTTKTLLRDDILPCTTDEAYLGFAGVGIVQSLGPGLGSIRKDLRAPEDQIEDENAAAKLQLKIDVGDWLVPAFDGLGTFRSLAVWDEKNVIKVPKNCMPLEYMANYREMSLAYCLLEMYTKDLMPGDRVIVNAANSTVGQCLIQLCRLVGLCTLAVIRKHENFEDTKGYLQFLGASSVFSSTAAIGELLKSDGRSLPRVAFDAVGGASTVQLVRSLQPGGQVVIYGFLSKLGPSSLKKSYSGLPLEFLVNTRISITGFSLTAWLQESAMNRVQFRSNLVAIGKLVQSKKLVLSFTEVPVSEFIQQASELLKNGSNTKVLVRFPTIDEEECAGDDSDAIAG